jgi:cell division protein ZapA
MGQVAINVNGRSYRFDCGDGEEARLQALAAYVKGRVDTLVREYGSVGDERLMLMAALLITDELWDTRAALEAAQKQVSLKEAALKALNDAAIRQALLEDAALNESGPVNGYAAERDVEAREADPAPPEYRRKLAAGGDG